MSFDLDEGFRQTVLQLAGSEVQTCIQCGTCSASCPTAHLMNPSIRKLIKLCLEGKKDEALMNDTIWLCTSCLLCTVRCPRGIRPKAVVSACKYLAEREGIKTKDAAYEQIFSKQIREYGRISELPLTGEFLLAIPRAWCSQWRWAWSWCRKENWALGLRGSKGWKK